MIGLKNVILISAASLLLSSCITSKKCNEKFPIAPISTDSVYSKVDTIIVFKDVPYNLPSFSFSSDWWKIADLIDDKETSIPKADIAQKGSVTVTKKGDNYKIKCTSDELQVIIDSLILEAEINQLTINNLQSVYTDVKAENKKLKILTKENVQNAKANKYEKLGKVLMWLFLIVALFIFVFSIFKFKK